MGAYPSSIESCKNHGCSYKDIEDKYLKHMLYFCQQSTSCYICKADVLRGTLFAHYGSVHRDITCRSGSTWRVPRDFDFQYRLVSSVAGTAVCWYKLTDKEFSFSVYTPVPTDRLREFRCKVKLTNPTTRHTQTYTPDVDVATSISDWNIKVKKKDLPHWSREFDLTVKISKIQ